MIKEHVMSGANVMVIEDEDISRSMLVTVLRNAGMQTTEASNGREAEQLLRLKIPQLILLDWMLPDVDGIQWTRQIKSDPKFHHVPIVMLTGRDETEDKLQALQAGVDDYVTKPFLPSELIARVAAIMRRSIGKRATTPRILRVGRITVLEDEHRVRINEVEVNVSPTEFRLLTFFLSHPRKAFTRAQLRVAVWPDSRNIEERTVDVHIRRLRKILSEHQCSQLIQTVREYGYRFSLPDE